MRNVSDKSCIVNQSAHIIFINLFPENRLWDNVGKCCKIGDVSDDDIIWHMHFTCWTAKATNTHSEYATPIVFPLQQLLHRRPSMLRYTYSARLVVE